MVSPWAVAGVTAPSNRPFRAGREVRHGPALKGQTCHLPKDTQCTESLHTCLHGGQRAKAAA